MGLKIEAKLKSQNSKVKRERANFAFLLLTF